MSSASNEILELILTPEGKLWCEKIYHLHSRFPKFFSKASAEFFLRYVRFLPPSFLKQHSLREIFFLLKSLYRSEHFSQSRQVSTYILKKESSTFSLMVKVEKLDKYEHFTKEHILSGIQHLLSSVRLIENSYFTFTDGKRFFHYLEMTKVRGGYFTSNELGKISSLIDQTLIEKIELTHTPIVLPGVEESLFKYIRYLTHELTNYNDPPQVLISFSEYTGDQLKFLVVLVRPSTKKNHALSDFISTAAPSVDVILEKSVLLTPADSFIQKEAAIFKIQLKASLCCDQKKINLRTARQYVVKLLENFFGEIRDYNGGLLTKEDEQLDEIKTACMARGISTQFMDDIFHGIQPAFMRALIPTESCVDLLRAMHAIAVEPMEERAYLLKSFLLKHSQVVAIKTKEINWIKQLGALSNELPFQMIYSRLHEGEFEYALFYTQTSKEEFDLQRYVNEQIQHYILSPSPGVNKILRMNLQGGDPATLNPRFASDIHCHTLATLLFEGLTRINQNGEPEPALAHTIDVSPSGLEYVFRLRSSAWSNGESVTAYDFEHAWKLALMDNVPSFLCPKLFFYLKNAKQAREGRLPYREVGVYAKDRSTLCVALEKPCHHFLHLVATPLFFPLYGDSAEPSVFNGPFYVEEWRHDHVLSLSRNPFYWENKSTHLNGIRFYMDSHVPSIYQKFLNKELDIIGDPHSPLSVPYLKSETPHSHRHSLRISRVFWIHCNLKTFPLSNRRVRQALNLALDRHTIAKQTFYQQVPHASPFPIAYGKQQPNLSGEPERAGQIFDLALKELGLTQATFPTLHLTHSNLAFERNLATELQKQWKEKLGVNLLTKELSWTEFSSALEKGDFQLGGLFRRDLFYHPQYYLHLLQGSPSTPYSLKDPEFEELFAEIEGSSLPGPALEKMEQLLIDRAPVFPLLCQVSFGLVQDYLKGVSWSTNGCINLKEVRFDEYIQTHEHFSHPHSIFSGVHSET